MGMVFCMAQGHAQNPLGGNQQSVLDKFLNSAEDELKDFVKNNEKEFNAFRKKIMEEYIAFVRETWKGHDQSAPAPRPKDDVIPPVEIPKEELLKPIRIKPVRIETVIPPAPILPQPQPIAPIEEVPVTVEKTVDFVFFGTPGKVRFDTDKLIKLKAVKEDDVADALESIINSDSYDNMLIDCLNLRKELELSDWAYLQMLKALADQIAGKGTNESVLLLAYLYMQSGYQMRLAMDENGTKLYMLYASKHQIYNQTRYFVDGIMYYSLETLPPRLCTCEAKYPKEQQMSLLINSNQRFTLAKSGERTVSSKKYQDVKMTFTVNMNLINFYDTYPSSMLDGNQMTRWAMYANTPMNEDIAKQIYPTLKAKLEGLSQLDAVNRLLDMVQWGLDYEYDDKVWGHDRAFFAEESLHYDYCDCEDRAILFTRMVRDLLGLDCILVLYPRHLAAAVAFDSDVPGDYIQLNGKKFVISDPTYRGAPAGLTMKNMDNQSASVILLTK